MKCPNCTGELTSLKPTCMLEAVLSMLVERGYDEQHVLTLFALEANNVNIDDVLWEGMSPLIDHFAEAIGLSPYPSHDPYDPDGI
jgi:hypothetical protein